MILTNSYSLDPWDFNDKILISLVKQFFIFNRAILDYLCTFKTWKSRAKYSKVPTKMTSITTSIIQHIMLCLRKIISRSWKFASNHSFLKDQFLKVGTEIAYGLPPATWTAKADPKKMPMLKELNFNKLREAVLYCLSLYTEVVQTKMTGLPECFTKKKKKRCTTVTNHSYWKSWSYPCLTSTPKKNAQILHFLRIVNSQAVVTTQVFVNNLSTICLRMYGARINLWNFR